MTPHDQIESIWNDINIMETAFIPYRDETIKKWCDKIQTASASSVGAHKKFKTINQGTLDQITTLMNDKERLVKKTRLKRGSYKILGEVKKGGIGGKRVCFFTTFSDSNSIGV
jgi:protein AATF/BFR2